MKKLNIAWTLLIALFMVSCTTSGDNGERIPTRASMSVTIDPGEESNRETVNSVRIIVFDNYSNEVKLDVNRYMKIESGNRDGDKIVVNNLEVSANEDKMVIVVINEPPASSFDTISSLDEITHPQTLQNILYDIEDILNTDGSILSASGIPMIGVVSDISIEGDESKRITMEVDRAVARVDFYLEAINGGAEVGYTTGATTTTVTLHNLTYDSYFVMGNVANGTRDNTDTYKNYGRIMRNVADSSLRAKTWTAGENLNWTYSSAADAENRRKVCSFYTAERIFRADRTDRLAISISNVYRDGGTTGVSMREIESVAPGEGGAAIEFIEIRRNNIYEITARVPRAIPITFSVSVQPWTTDNVEIPIN